MSKYIKCIYNLSTYDLGVLVFLVIVLEWVNKDNQNVNDIWRFNEKTFFFIKRKMMQSYQLPFVLMRNPNQ
jgi:uncharacterized BrkB/YihY/UPF0761 family membrane protein